MGLIVINISSEVFLKVWLIFFFGDELRLTIDFSYSRVTRVGQWTASLVTQTGGIILILAKVLTHCLIMRLTSSRCSFDLIRTKLMVSEKMESKKRSQVEKKHPHVHRFQWCEWVRSFHQKDRMMKDMVKMKITDMIDQTTSSDCMVLWKLKLVAGLGSGGGGDLVWDRFECDDQKFTLFCCHSPVTRVVHLEMVVACHRSCRRACPISWHLQYSTLNSTLTSPGRDSSLRQPEG